MANAKQLKLHTETLRRLDASESTVVGGFTSMITYTILCPSRILAGEDLCIRIPAAQ